MIIDEKEFRVIRDDFRRELILCNEEMDRLYAEVSNRFAAMCMTTPSASEDKELHRLDTILRIAEGELAIAYLKEHGWHLEKKFWEK